MMSITTTFKTRYDVVIVGGGHNGLTSAAYLAKAGLSVLVLEKQPVVGGAAISLPIFDGINAKLSRYSYLMSLFPSQISNDLELRFESRKRAMASFTPTVRDGQHKALLVSNTDPNATVESFRQLTGGDSEYRNFQHFEALCSAFATRVWPTLLRPLVTRAEMQKQFDTAEARKAWEIMIEQPFGVGLENILHDDIVRGLVFTNANIGVLTHPHDPTLLQNRTHIYHIVGQGTGEWRIVTGGMGAITQELARAGREAGAELVTEAVVSQIGMGETAEIQFTHGDKTHTVSARYVLANVAPTVLRRMLPEGAMPAPEVEPEGSVFKINLLLKRLPRLKASQYTPYEAFTGTFHAAEGYQAMQESYQVALNGNLPELPPGELYCQTITDPTTLTPELREAGYQTLTLFGVNLPARLFRADNDGTRAEVVKRYLKVINQYLDEPIEDCLAIDAHGQPCIEAKTPLDLEAEIGLPAGHIFHQDLTWPFVDEPMLAGTWGVETAHPNLFICGSGALRGGCVSGIPGHNAAMKVLECEGKQ